MSDKTVTILGSGPAGLLAALAAEQKGYKPTIISKGEASPIGGAQYLHSHVPGLTSGVDPQMITYVKVGDMDGYARKAYGEPGAQVSWDTFVTGEYPAWSLEAAYGELWARYGNEVQAAELTPADIDKFLIPGEPVFSSIPLPFICKDRTAHGFKSQEVVFTEEDYVKVPNMIVYNGRESDSWYRAACLFGHCSAEYHATMVPEHVQKMHFTDVHTGVKPVSNECNCYTKYANFHKIGRFGQWRRGILSDHAYHDVQDRL